jgi:hypothetical protein
VLKGDGDDDNVEAEVDRHQGDRHTDGLFESAKENRAQQRQQEQSHNYLVASEERLEVRVFYQMGGGVGSGQGHGDDEVGGGEAQQHQDEDLALPERHQPLQHGKRPLAVRTL